MAQLAMPKPSVAHLMDTPLSPVGDARHGLREDTDHANQENADAG